MFGGKSVLMQIKSGITVDLQVDTMRAESGSHNGLSDKRVDGQALFDGRLFLRVVRGSFREGRIAICDAVALRRPSKGIFTLSKSNLIQPKRERSILAYFMDHISTGWPQAPS